jgi:hypothetical protein
MRTLTLAVSALLFSSYVLANEGNKSIKLPLTKRKGNKNSLPPRKIDYPKANQLYQAAEEFSEFLSGFGRESSMIEVDVDNQVSLYSTNVYLGSARKAFNVDIDTGSDILVIQDTSCTACQKTFDSSTSTTFVDSTTTDSITYGDGSYVHGYKVKDSLSLTSTGSVEATDFNFLLGYSQKGFSDMDGLIGMSRTYQTNYDMFWEQLYTQGQIPSSTFAFYMADSTSDQSTLQVGGYDTSYLMNSDEITYLPLLGSSLFYVVSVDAWQVGSTPGGVFKPSGYTMAYTSPAILDTGTTLMLVPTEFYHPIMSRIVEGTPAVKARGGYYIDYCSNSDYYPSLYLLMGGTWMEVPASSYMFNFYSDYCMVGIQSAGAHYWLLGDGFLKNFYTIWDNTNAQVGIGPHKTSSSAYLTTSDMASPSYYFTELTYISDIAAEISRVVLKVGLYALIIRGAVWLVVHAFSAVFGIDNVMGITKDNIHSTVFV